MDPSGQLPLNRLRPGFRELIARLPVNPWEEPALKALEEKKRTEVPSNPLFWKNLYCPTGSEALEIMIQMHGRPNPEVPTPIVDLKCPIVVCDMEAEDQPIIFASDPFYQLTGYNRKDVIGKNCRFLQAPHGTNVMPGSTRRHVDNESVRRMRDAVYNQRELEIKVVNFKKSGAGFVNFLTIIMVSYKGRRYSVGLLSESK